MYIDIIKSSKCLLKARLWYYSVAFAHLFYAAIVLLSIDMSQDKDPAVSAYIYIRWRLLTSWFNLLTLCYFPMCIYCDWMELNGRGDEKPVIRLRQIKEVLFTSIIFPTTMYCDILFWRVWQKDPSLIAPVRIFDYLPYWTHHSLHSFSGVTVFIDLLIVPRKRPASLLPGMLVTTAFVTVYASMVAITYANGVAVYSVLNVFDSFKITLLMIMSYLEHYFYYTLQWCIVDLVWKNRVDTEKIHTN
ncbi:unnamed protein product [Colias eurytheme]|nr:unnamed protein product [Colias eurytheme]